MHGLQWIPSLPLPLEALPLMGGMVRAGFPSPADDFIEQSLDLNDFLVRHPAATFFARVRGHSMAGEGIFEGDYLVVDRSFQPTSHSVVIATMDDGEMMLKRLKDIKPDQVWGVVTSVIRKL